MEGAFLLLAKVQLLLSVGWTMATDLTMSAGTPCFDDAIPAHERRNLSYKNKMYALPIGQGVWSSPQAPAQIVSILLTERLGINVDMLGGIGSSVDTLKVIAGCDGGTLLCNDAEFMAGQFKDPPTVWMAPEVWITAAVEENMLQYVRSAGPIGYTSTPSLQTFAWVHEAAKGHDFLLGFWESLYQPEAKSFFSDVSSLDVAIRNLSVPRQMGQFFGCVDAACDAPGLVLPGHNNGVPADAGTKQNLAKLNISFTNGWYYSPACQHNTSKCIPVVLGENLWNFREWCLVAQKQNLPLAITFMGWFGEQVVVKSLGKLNYSFLFYWWRPDPTFLEFAPKMTYFDESILYISQFQHTEKIVWSRLNDVDPAIFAFIRSISIPNEAIASIMDQYALADPYTLACNWLKANSAVWNKWLPMANCPKGEYFNLQRWECRVCEPGKFTNEEGLTSCHLCVSGRYSDRSASFCKDCLAGSYVDADGQSSCKRCSSGKFAQDDGMTACELCEPGKTTDASESGPIPNQCTKCQEGYFSSTGGTICSVCASGKYASEDAKSCNKCAPGFTGPVFCKPDEFWILALLLFMIAFILLFEVAKLWYCGKHIKDISDRGDEGVVVSLCRGVVSVPRNTNMRVYFRGTGDSRLNAADRTFIANSDQFDASNVFYLTDKDDDVPTDINTSMGTMYIQFRSVLRSRIASLAFSLLTFVLAVAVALQRELPILLSAVFCSIVLSCMVYLPVFWFRKMPPILYVHKFHTKRILYGGHEPVGNSPGGLRAVQLVDLKSLHSDYELFIRERTMHYVCPNIIAPLTQKWQLSYAEIVGPCESDYFVSHYWGTPFRHFVASLELHAKDVGSTKRSHARNTKAVGAALKGSGTAMFSTSGTKTSLKSSIRGTMTVTKTTRRRTEAEAWQKISYWICSLSNNQWRLSEEIQDDLHNCSFYLALTFETCRATVMVVDADAKPLERSWCLFEVLQTFLLHNKPTDSDFEGLFFATDLGVLNFGKGSYDVAAALGRRLACFDTRDAEASEVEDKQRIDELIRAHEGGFDTINSYLRHNMAGALSKIKKNFQRDFVGITHELSDGVPAMVAGAPWRAITMDSFMSTTDEPDSPKTIVAKLVRGLTNESAFEKPSSGFEKQSRARCSVVLSSRSSSVTSPSEVGACRLTLENSIGQSHEEENPWLHEEENLDLQAAMQGIEPSRLLAHVVATPNSDTIPGFSLTRSELLEVGRNARTRLDSHTSFLAPCLEGSVEEIEV